MGNSYKYLIYNFQFSVLMTKHFRIYINVSQCNLMTTVSCWDFSTQTQENSILDFYFHLRSHFNWNQDRKLYVCFYICKIPSLFISSRGLEQINHLFPPKVHLCTFLVNKVLVFNKKCSLKKKLHHFCF